MKTPQELEDAWHALGQSWKDDIHAFAAFVQSQTAADMIEANPRRVVVVITKQNNIEVLSNIHANVLILDFNSLPFDAQRMKEAMMNPELEENALKKIWPI